MRWELKKNILVDLYIAGFNVVLRDIVKQNCRETLGIRKYFIHLILRMCLIFAFVKRTLLSI